MPPSDLKALRLCVKLSERSYDVIVTGSGGEKARQRGYGWLLTPPLTMNCDKIM